MEETIRVGIYARLSRDDERFGESMSIENQKLMLNDYCDRQGWEIVDVYADDGFTGLTFDRPEMQRLIEDAKNGRINTVLVKDLSRFGRNYVEAGQLIDDLFPLLNIRLVAPNDGVDTHTNQNTDFIPIRNVFNEYYCKDISRKVISARKASAKQGNFMGSSAPYGYWLDPNDRHKLIIDEDAAVVVQRIFRMRADDCSYNQIADTLNREGIPNPRDYYYHKIGKPNPRVMRHYWSEITVTHILKNEVYIGNMVQFKTGVVSYKNHSIRAKPEETWIRCENTHEPIIDRKLWDAVQSKFRKKQTKQRRTQSGELPLFSGLLKCADCGGLMHFKPDMNKRKDGTCLAHHSYCCRTYKQSGASACTSHWTGEQQLISLVKSELAEFAKQIEIDEQGVRDRLIAERSKNVKTEQSAMESRRQTISNRIVELDTMLSRLYEEMLLGQLPRDVLMDLSNRYNSEKEEKQYELAELDARLAEFRSVVEDVEKWLTVLKQYLSGMELDRALLHKLIREIKVGAYTKVNGVKYQDIEIAYSFQ